MNPYEHDKLQAAREVMNEGKNEVRSASTEEEIIIESAARRGRIRFANDDSLARKLKRPTARQLKRLRRNLVSNQG